MRKIKLNSSVAVRDGEEEFGTFIERLISGHRLTKLINELLRVYYKNPERFTEIKGHAPIAVEQTKQDFSRNQKDYKEYLDKLSEFSKKQDTLAYNIKLLRDNLAVMNSLLELHKVVGLPERAHVNFSATLLMKREVNDLSAKLGLPMPTEYSQDLNKLTEEMLAKAVEHYDNVLNEIRLFQNVGFNTVIDGTVSGNGSREVYKTPQPEPKVSSVPVQKVEEFVQQTEEKKVEPDVDAAMDMFGSMFPEI